MRELLLGSALAPAGAKSASGSSSAALLSTQPGPLAWGRAFCACSSGSGSSSDVSAPLRGKSQNCTSRRLGQHFYRPRAATGVL